MKRFFHPALGMLLLAAAFAAAQKPAELVDSTFRKVTPGGAAMAYRFYGHKELLTAKRKFPLVIYLHGRDQDLFTDDRFMGISKSFADPAIYKKRPCFLLAPQCPKGESWDETHLKQAMQIIRELAAGLPVDPQRIYLTGFSMGAGGAYKLLSMEPDFFAAAAVVAGQSNPQTAGQIKHIPLQVYIGLKDEEQKIAASRKMAEALKAAGAAEFLYTEIKDMGHTGAPLKEPALQEWLFKHTLQNANSGKP